MGIFVPDPEKLYTFCDYENWPADAGYELIEGKPAKTAKAAFAHHRAAHRIHNLFGSYLSAKGGEALYRFDVRLKGKSGDCVVCPDVQIACNAQSIGESFVSGAPDLICEVASPETAVRDFYDKRVIYEANGVKEYWTASVSDRFLLVLVLEEGAYRQAGIYFSGEAKSPTFAGLSVEVDSLFV
ncbi:MAG: Uma2 family endonuclease [Eubacteriaceae bacterium]|jgi:Uma2 family endonuclease|nr:Uma2 family endonuclease [Eubacteriaceae bacterium]